MTSKTGFRLLRFALLTASLMAFWPGAGVAQLELLTPQQQRLLDQLPPAQRAAALDQLRKLTQSGSLPSTPEQSAPEEADAEAEQEDPDEMDFQSMVPRLEPSSTVIIEATIPEDSGPATTVVVDPEVQQSMLDNIRRENPYRLDELGRLYLPGIDAINLAGLTEMQAGLRLTSDPKLMRLNYTVTLLPLSAVGTDAIEPFGYALFERDEEPAQEGYAIPVPANYVIGPGDSIRVQLFGSKNAEYEMDVERDGSVRFPEFGPLSVGGLTFAQLRSLLEQRVKEQLIGTQVSVTMGTLRLIQVFLVGDVNEPGALTIGSLSTITTVLNDGGGVAPHGSLRDVQLKRNGELVGSLDVYDLLLKGDTSDDLRVQAGDVVFVPPVGARITVAGEVKRPGIYEYKGDANVDDILRLAGGLRSGAYRGGIKIERLDPDRGHLTVDVRLDETGGGNVAVRDGDTLNVPAGISKPESSVQLVGNVQRSGSYEWRPDFRLSDLIPGSRALKPGSDLHYVMIRREPRPNGKPVVLSANLEAAWEMQGQPVDLRLEPRDTVYVFSIETGRAQYVTPLIEELQLRASLDDPMPIATIDGSVHAPGQFPLEPGMRVADLVRAGGGLTQSAYVGEAELTRYSVDAGNGRTTSVTTIDLNAALSGDAAANVRLQSFDYLNIRETPNWRDEEFVTIGGEVEFPGRYPIRQGETLSSVIARAGGLTDLAFPRGSVLTRETLKKREKEQIEVLAARLERDLASLSLSDSTQSEALSIGQTLLNQLRSAEPVGRLVIDLDKAMQEGSRHELVVRNGDTLRIPQQSQEVTVLGEVQYSTSHVYSANLSREDYIQRSGGTTAKADSKRTYVVRASGEVVADGGSRFFARAGRTGILPGDTIVVPLDTDRIRPLTLWTNVTQIVYNLAIAATAVSRF